MNTCHSIRGRRLEVRVQGSGKETANCKLQIANCKLRKARPSPLTPLPKGEGTVDSGQWAVGGGRRETASDSLHPSSFILHPYNQGSGFSTRHSPLATRHSYLGFTLIELLVTIAIISILAGISLGAVHYARHAAAEAKTKATIAKLNALVMQRYESYITRRVPIDTTGMNPRNAAKFRYLALLDLMRMEMPERTYDIYNGPLNGSSGLPWTARPALNQMYLQKYNNSQSQNPPGPVDNCRSAKYLYMWVSMTYPEAMEQFSQNEIADLNGDGWPVFVDGWGMPIMFLRWAPGFSSGVGLNPNWFNSNLSQPRVDVSEIQTGDPINDHDPFDSRRIFPGSTTLPCYYRLIPLIYSAGPDKKYGINIVHSTSGDGYFYGIDLSSLLLNDLNPYTIPTGGQAGTPSAEDDGTINTHFDNIHNHRIEQQ
jgi:prepilin-type N-terminal cleavage/methylation domain-containing protein